MALVTASEGDVLYFSSSSLFFLFYVTAQQWLGRSSPKDMFVVLFVNDRTSVKVCPLKVF